MERDSAISQGHGFYGSLVSAWFKLNRRKIRLLQAGNTAAESPQLFAVSHPAGLLPALAISLPFRGSIRCLLPKSCVRGALAGFLARQMNVILYEGESPISEANGGEALDVLQSGGTLAVFVDQLAAEQTAPGSVSATAASIVEQAESQADSRRVTIHPVHLFLPQSIPHSREILIYIDTPIDRATPAITGSPAEPAELSARIEARFHENAFQLRAVDLEFFLSDLEVVLRSNLQDDWASRPDWKQDTEGFVLSRFTSDWIKRMNYLHPERLVGLRETLDSYRGLQKTCALRELEVGGGEHPLGTGWSRVGAWFETVVGLPVAIYGLLNHWAIALVLFLAGSFKRNRTRTRTTEFIIRASVVLTFYILQIYFVEHRWGRSAAGYYAPSLPISGLYLWRYAGLVRPQARLLFIALTIPSLKRKIQRLRQTLMNDLDRALASIEE
jgi:hypothetical protein